MGFLRLLSRNQMWDYGNGSINAQMLPISTVLEVLVYVTERKSKFDFGLDHIFLIKLDTC
jgi:hypothetical protein